MLKASEAAKPSHVGTWSVFVHESGRNVMEREGAIDDGMERVEHQVGDLEVWSLYCTYRVASSMIGVEYMYWSENKEGLFPTTSRYECGRGR